MEKQCCSERPQEIGRNLAIAYKSPIARFLLGRMFQRNLRRNLSGHYLKASARNFSKYLNLLLELYAQISASYLGEKFALVQCSGQKINL